MAKLNAKKELEENQTIVAIIPSMKYNKVSLDVVKQLSKHSICYVTLNKTYTSIEETLKKKKVNTDNIVFIDAITKTIKKAPKQAKGVYFVSSPGALTELSLTIKKFLKHNFKYLIFDSLTNLTIYQNKSTVAKFISSLVNNIKESETKAIFYALDMSQHEELIQESCMFVDKALKIKK